VNVRETRHETGTCISMGYSRRQTIVLAAPLGNRVLVDAATNASVPIA
jgi:hypothetical protein